MPILVITLGAITLPEELRWVDEHAWSPVARSGVDDYSLTGAPLRQAAIKQAGRPITLQHPDAWVQIATLTNLQAINANPLWEGVLTLADGRNFNVAFRDEGIAAEPVIFQSPFGAKDGWWRITLKLETVT